jgi:hypothetical protein
LGILSSSIHSRWSSQLILCPFIHFTIFPHLLNSSSSRCVLLFHSPSSYLGPYTRMIKIIRILNFGTTPKWAVSFKRCPIYPNDKYPLVPTA